MILISTFQTLIYLAKNLKTENQKTENQRPECETKTREDPSAHVDT